MNVRQFESARTWFRRAGELDLSNGESEFWLARVERMSGRPDRMHFHLANARKLGFPAKRLKREQVLSLLQSGRMREVATDIPALLIDPGDDGAAICESLASGYLRAYRINEAMHIIEAWRRDYPNDPEPLVVRGIYFGHRQSWGKAAQEFEKALELAPSRDDVRLQWGQALLNLNQFDLARAQFERCLRTSPRETTALIGLGRCFFESGEVQEARRLFEQALQITPDSLIGRLLMGKLLAADAQPEAAVLLLEAVTRELPYETDARYSLALALQASGRVDVAREHFQYVLAQQRAQSEVANKLQILEREPQRVDLRYEIGQALLEYGNPEEGIEWMRTVLELEPTHRNALAALADYSRPRDAP